MTTLINPEWITAALLLSLRVAAAMLVAPVFGPMQVPAGVRVWLSLSLGVLLVPVLGVTAFSITDMGALLSAALAELFIGASLGFGFMVAYAATQIAGRVLDVQLGFGVASILNPATQTLAPLLGALFGMVLVMVYLSMDGHHVLIQALVLSVQNNPPGLLPDAINWEAIVAQSGIMFSYALALAGPVMLTLLLIDLAMAVIARSMQQLNVFVLSFAVKIGVGLSVLATSVQFAGGVYRSLVESTFGYWQAGVAL